MTEHTRVLPNEIREGAQKPFRFLRRIGDINVFLVIVTIIIFSFYGKSDEKVVKTSLLNTEQEGFYTQAQKEVNVEYLKVTAPPFPQLSREIDTRGYDWSCDKDIAAGLKNMNNLIAVTVKDSKGVIKTFREERLPDGRIADLYIPYADADCIQVSSLETYPVSSLDTLTKKL